MINLQDDENLTNRGYLPHSPYFDEKPKSNQSLPKAVIVTEDRIGHGNLAFAIKLANSIKNKYNINFLLTSDSDEDTLKNIFRVNFPCVTEIPKDCAICLVAINYQIGDDLISQFRGKKIIIFSQYDMDVTKDGIGNNIGYEKLKSMGAEIIKTGIAPENIGIFLEEKLLPKTDDEKRNFSDYYNELDNQDLKALLRADIKDMADYPNSRTLSFAYISDFDPISTIILHGHYHHISENKRTSYDLVIINSCYNFYAISSTVKSVIKEFKNIYDKITFVDLSKLLPFKKDPSNGNKHTREFRIIFTRLLTHTDLLTLHKMIGNNFCTVTGDQSLSEVISKCAPFNYLCQPWKKNLYTHLQKNIPALREVEKHLEGIISSPQYEKAAQIIYDNRNSFLNFCLMIRNQKNLGKIISDRLESKHLSASSITTKDLKNAVAKALEKYTEINKKPIQSSLFVEKFGKHGITGIKNAVFFENRIQGMCNDTCTPKDVYQVICNHLKNGPGNFEEKSFKTILIQELSKITLTPPEYLLKSFETIPISAETFSPL